MAKTYTLTLFLIAVIYVLGQVKHSEAASKRCKWLGEWACKGSCKVLGHDSGTCDENNNCICSEIEYDFLSEIKQLVDENIDLGAIKENLKTKFNELKGTVTDWARDENLRALVPSKCRISQSFCDKACRAIGKMSGSCSSDNSDCDCSDEWATLTQYKLCASETICRLDCQASGKATGKCVNGGGWDCECETRNSEDSENSGDVESMDVRRKRSMWSNNGY